MIAKIVKVFHGIYTRSRYTGLGDYTIKVFAILYYVR